jgi:hypothetical protein
MRQTFPMTFLGGYTGTPTVLEAYAGHPAHAPGFIGPSQVGRQKMGRSWQPSGPTTEHRLRERAYSISRPFAPKVRVGTTELSATGFYSTARTVECTTRGRRMLSLAANATHQIGSSSHLTPATLEGCATGQYLSDNCVL